MKTSPEIVTAERLRELWMQTDAISMTDNHQTGYRTVRMEDGREYAASFGDLLRQHHSEADR